MVLYGGEMDQQFVRLVDSLAERFAGVHERDTVAQVVGETRARLEAGARVTAYLPILVARHAVDLLAGREAPTGSHRPGPIVAPDHRVVSAPVPDPATRRALLATS